MTDGPRRLNRSGGMSQRLLDSASLDKPSHASRRHAENLASTASAFASSHRPGAKARPLSPVRTLATWIGVGAAASVALGFVASTLLEPAPAPQAAAPLATVPSPAPRSAAGPSDISAEPAVPATTPKPGIASSQELREIEAARSALSRGDAEAAIAHLNNYDSSHPNGTLKPEAMALRIQVLGNSGKTTEARTLANEFEEKYPSHPLLQQVRGGGAK